MLVLSRPKQEDDHELEASLSYIYSKSLSYNKRETEALQPAEVLSEHWQAVFRPLLSCLPFPRSVYLGNLARPTEIGPPSSPGSSTPRKLLPSTLSLPAWAMFLYVMPAQWKAPQRPAY